MKNWGCQKLTIECTRKRNKLIRVKFVSSVTSSFNLAFFPLTLKNFGCLSKEF